jgi:hypothetical protein
MSTTRIRLIGVTAAALALVAGAGAAVSAQPGLDASFQGGTSLELREPRGMGGPFRGGGGGFGGLRGGLLDRFDALVRQETTYQTDDGLVTRRVDNGTLVAIDSGSVEYSLADGQTASATIDDDTEVIAFEEETVEFGRRGLTRQRLAAQEVEASSIAVGSEVLVWSESTSDGTFVAQRLVVQPEVAAADDTAAEAAESEDATGSEEVAVSPAPEVSPASA